MKCSNCGHELNPGSGFCENCGMILGVDNFDNNSQSTSDSTTDFNEFDEMLGLESTVVAGEAAGEVIDSVESEIPANEPVEEPIIEEAPVTEPISEEPAFEDQGEPVFEDVASTDEEYDDSFADYETEEAEEFPEDTQPVDDSDDNGGFVSTEGEEMLVSKKNKKGPLVASIAAVFLVAVAAGAITMKNGDLFSVLKKTELSESSSQSTSLDTSVTEESSENTTKDTTEETSEETSEESTEEITETEEETTKKDKTTEPSSTKSDTTKATNSSTTKAETTKITNSSTTKAETTKVTKPSTTKAETTKVTKPSTTKEETTKEQTTKSETTLPNTTDVNNSGSLIKKLGLPAVNGSEVEGTVVPPAQYLSKSYPVYVNTQSNLTLRTEPKDNGAWNSTLRYGRELTVLAKSNNWVFVYAPYYNRYGWINTKYTSVTRPSTIKTIVSKGVTEPEVKFEAKEIKYSTVNYLYLRPEPKKDSTYILSLEKGEPLEVLGKMKDDSTWLYVRDTVTGYTGWVTAQYVK